MCKGVWPGVTIHQVELSTPNMCKRVWPGVNPQPSWIINSKLSANAYDQELPSTRLNYQLKVMCKRVLPGVTIHQVELSTQSFVQTSMAMGYHPPGWIINSKLCVNEYNEYSQELPSISLNYQLKVMCKRVWLGVTIHQVELSTQS